MTAHDDCLPALREARDHGSHADARNIQSLITMLHEGRFEEMPATIARLGLTPADDPALLIVRPEAEVRIVRPDTAMARLFGQAGECITIGNLLATPPEPGGKDNLSPEDLMPALIALIAAGALQECPVCALC